MDASAMHIGSASEIEIARDGRGYRLETTTSIPAPVEAVFGFFADAANLQLITPPRLNFQILTPLPIAMGVGTRIDYRLRLHGVPFRWRTLISAWEPERRFVDEQERGPYRWWVHEHRFARDGAHTLMTDCVRFGFPGGTAAGLYVLPSVRSIFTHRAQVIRARQFSAVAGPAFG